jgi:aspartyl-tRNA synthetase
VLTVFFFSLCYIFLFFIFMFQALHHPFTAPNPGDMDDLASARALAYDMIYNGVEVLYLFMN